VIIEAPDWVHRPRMSQPARLAFRLPWVVCRFCKLETLPDNAERFVECGPCGWFQYRVRVPPKLGRWAYCKYCYQNVQPLVGPDGSIVVCSRCFYGLAPMDRVERLGSLASFMGSL
jgi:hypothetical protein